MEKSNITADTDYKYLVDMNHFLQKEMQNSEFRKAYEEESLKYIIAEKVKHKRKEKKLSQAKLADKVKTTQKVISNIERGEVSIEIGLLQRIASALDLRINII
jgi:ribosome-binding protein aMBF1 (putative translation factor)